MSLLFTLFFFGLIIYFIINKNYNGLLFIILLSLIGDRFSINFFGSNIWLYRLISLLLLPFLFNKFENLSKVIRGIRIEYFLLLGTGLLFGFIFPWDDGSLSRSWSQVASGRAVVALVSILSDILLIYVSYYFFVSQKVSLSKFLNLLSLIVIITSIVAFFDYFTNYTLYSLLFSDLPENIRTRLVGFSTEPRGLGRSLVVSWMFLFIYKINGFNFKFGKISIILGFITILFSFSFSSYFIFLVGSLIIFKTYVFRKKFVFIIMVLAISIGAHFISKINYVKVGIAYRYLMVTEGKVGFQMEGEPFFFTRFDVFDRAALNFFKNNPNYLLLGTGPNLISIPGSKYLDRSAINTFNGSISGIPGFGVINLVSRSGFIGLFLYLIVFIRIYKLLNNQTNTVLRDLFIVISISYVFVVTPWLYFTIGFVLAQQAKISFNNKK